MHRLINRYNQNGAAGLVSQKRGKPSNRRHTRTFKNAVMALIQERYADFGPTLAREKLYERHNRRFAKTPYNDRDMHRPLTDYDSLDTALCIKQPRTVSNSLTLQYDHVRFILTRCDQTAGLQRKQVMIYDHPDGRVEILHKGIALPYTIFDKVRHVDQSAIVSNKRLGEVLAHIAANQDETAHKRATGSPRRQGQKNSMFAKTNE